MQKPKCKYTLRLFNTRDVERRIPRGEDFRIGQHVGTCLFNFYGLVCMLQKRRS